MLKPRSIWSGKIPGAPVRGPTEHVGHADGVVVMIELSAIVSLSWWIWLNAWVTSCVADRRNARGMLRCMLVRGAPKLLESEAG